MLGSEEYTAFKNVFENRLQLYTNTIACEHVKYAIELYQYNVDRSDKHKLVTHSHKLTNHICHTLSLMWLCSMITYYETSKAHSAVCAVFAGNNHTDLHIAYFDRLLDKEVAGDLFQSKL